MPFVAGGDGYVRVLNPIAENEAHLRRSVLETLARRAEHNLARMEGNLRLFEIGSAFEPGEGELPDGRTARRRVGDGSTTAASLHRSEDAGVRQLG